MYALICQFVCFIPNKNYPVFYAYRSIVFLLKKIVAITYQTDYQCNAANADML